VPRAPAISFKLPDFGLQPATLGGPSSSVATALASVREVRRGGRQAAQAFADAGSGSGHAPSSGARRIVCSGAHLQGYGGEEASVCRNSRCLSGAKRKISLWG
jgi:hypothetical protein